jgi:hypothetical protein
MSDKDKSFDGFPLGHFDPTHLAQDLAKECALIGGLVIAWGQFDQEVCNLFSRLLGFSGRKPTDKRAHAVFYSSTSPKARRDAMLSLAKLVDDELCRKWLIQAIEKVGDAGNKRNNIIHSEYFSNLANPTDSHLKQNSPAAKNPTITRTDIRRQINNAVIALREARFFMEFGYAATRGREDLEQALRLYEPALRQRLKAQQPDGRAPDSR